MSTRRAKDSDIESEAVSETSSIEEEENSDDEETQREYDFAKYWCPKTQKVVVGVQIRTTPIALSSISGTYHWFYEIPEEHYDWPRQVSYQSDDPPGHFTLSCPPGNNNKKILNRISGDLDHFGKKGKFTGLLQVQNWEKKDILNYWDIKKILWEKDYGDNEEEGNGLQVLEVCDDDGNPFIMFKYFGPGMAGMVEYLNVLAKKQKDGESEPQALTTTECERLGIDMRHSEIRARAISDAASPNDAGMAKGDEEAKKLSCLARFSARCTAPVRYRKYDQI